MLTSTGIRFRIDPCDIDESLHPGESPGDYIMRLARAKVIDVAGRHGSGLIIGADTTVVADGEILGKPCDDAEARRMLRRLSGRWHAVMTGVAVYDVESRRESLGYAETMVRFADLSDEEICWYIATGEHRDKAGAYAIQGRASLFVEEISGNYHNVVGLPISLLYRLAGDLGVQLIDAGE